LTPAQFWTELVGSLQSSAFRDVAGTRISARVPISRNLLNRLVRSTVAASPHVRDVDIRPHAGDAFDVLITVSWPFVPAIKVACVLERQPQLPASPAVVLRWSLLGAAGVIASRFIAWLDRLPAGVRLDGDRLVLDIPRLAEGTPAASVLPYIRSLEFHTVDDRVVVEVEMEIEYGESGPRPDGC
jgi:hypothetical protein